MGHGELRRRFRRGRVWEEEKEIETVRNTAGVTEERVCLCADMNMQSKQISFKPQTLLSCLSILHQASPTHWLRGYLFNNSYQYFMQRINNAFDHPLSVADAAAISFFTSSRWPGLASIKSARDMDQAKTGEVDGKERRDYTWTKLCLPCSQVSLSDDTAGMFLWVTSLPQAGTHTLWALLLMHRQPNFSLETNAHTLRVSAGIYLPNCAPIDSEEFISVVTQAHKFSFAPPGQGCCCYHSTDDWTLA